MMSNTNKQSEAIYIKDRAVLFIAIVKDGKASAFLKAAKNHGVSGGTIVKAEGVIASRMLSLFGLADSRREILLMVVPKGIEAKLHQELHREFQMERPNHGILFSHDISRALGVHHLRVPETKELGGENMGHQLIMTIVERNKSDEVLDAAKAGGARGGTVLHGRGSGTHEHCSLFNIDIEPEKEIVLILAAEAETDAIVESIRSALKLDEPGGGVLFTMQVNQASGLFQSEV